MYIYIVCGYVYMYIYIYIYVYIYICLDKQCRQRHPAAPDGRHRGVRREAH